MTVNEIIEAHLKDEGFDGLFHEDGCGCRLGDLIPCDGECFQHCEPGYIKHIGPHDFDYMIIGGVRE